MRAIILTYEKFQDHEVIYPYYALQEHGFDVTVCSNTTGRIFGILGAHVVSDIRTCDLFTTGYDKEDDSDLLDDFDLLFIPGGVKALEKLRLDNNAVKFTKKWFEQDRPCMVICNGPQLLITADVLRGRTCSGYYAIQKDIENAGATYSRIPVRDGNLVSAAHYDDMPEWMNLSMEMFKNAHF